MRRCSADDGNVCDDDVATVSSTWTITLQGDTTEYWLTVDNVGVWMDRHVSRQLSILVLFLLQLRQKYA